MGEFFKDTAEVEPEQEEELITNFDELCRVYDALANKIKETTDQGYEAILPIRTELNGAGKTPDDIGQIGELRREIRQSRVQRMSIGITMWATLKNIEDLDKWSDRYTDYLEKYIDGLKTVAKSAFKIVVNARKEVDDSKKIVEAMKEQMVALTEVAPELIPPMKERKPDVKKKLTAPEITLLIDEQCMRFYKAQEGGDEDTMGYVHEQIKKLCGSDKKRLASAMKKLKGHSEDEEFTTGDKQHASLETKSEDFSIPDNSKIT